MRYYEIINESKDVVYHGDNRSKLKMNNERGIYFSTDMEYAKSYGKYLYTCRVVLKNPCINTEEEANGFIEIERPILISNGYDGRVVTYDDGEKDVIAFYLDQIEILEIK